MEEVLTIVTAILIERRIIFVSADHAKPVNKFPFADGNSILSNLQQHPPSPM
jgi:hypothetical protein